MPTIIVVAGVVKDLKLAELMLILSMLIPFFLFLLKELSENSNANKRLEHLYSFFEEIFRKLEDKSLNTELISKQLRSIQDEIFESRTCSPLVPEWIYKRFRSIDSSEMDRVILELIEKMKRVETLQ